jgi:hypothetical protein
MRAAGAEQILRVAWRSALGEFDDVVDAVGHEGALGASSSVYWHRGCANSCARRLIFHALLL